MPRAPDRLIAAAVHRPFAEQLVALSGVHVGERVIEVGPVPGELTRALRGRGASVDVHPAVADGAFDLAVSLFGLPGDASLPGTLGEMARVARRGRVLVWEDGATHVAALRAAWDDVAGPPPGPPTASAAPPPAAGWSRLTIGDVARFDSVPQLCAALLNDAGLEPPPGLDGALLDALALRLSAHTAADGTLRIPVRATVLARG